jgi:hypothetical protein
MDSISLPAAKPALIVLNAPVAIATAEMGSIKVFAPLLYSPVFMRDF